MSILARSTRAPFGNSPARMRRNRSRFSSTARSRNGLFLPGSVSVPRLTRISLRRLVVDIGLAGLDQLLGPLVELLEVVGGVKQVLAPVEAEPAHVALDRVDVLLLLLGRIGVVEAQVAAPAELLGDAEVQADRLGVADVQVAVRLGRKAGHHRRVPLGVEVGLDDVADEIAPAFCYSRLLVAMLDSNLPRRRGPALCQIRPGVSQAGSEGTMPCFCATWCATLTCCQRIAVRPI